jgi:beta-N-acetylhexosaminidase
MLDIEGLTLSPADRDLLREPAVGGLILFARNYASVEQLADLVAEVRALRSPPLLVAVDHEGGRVQRFREGFTAVPPMQRVGREFDGDAKAGLQAARDAGWLIGAELRAVGIDLGFAPCVDLDWGISEVIGARAFHRDPGVVADLADEFARGMRSAGMAAVAKHFPGHGAVIADSHLQLPVDRREYGMILDDMRPYERLVSNGSIAAVMTAHIVYEKVDDARLALEAGCDMVPICNDRDAAQEAADALAGYSNPLSLVRLARLHGTGQTPRESLLASEKWQTINARFRHWDERPEFHLDA